MECIDETDFSGINPQADIESVIRQVKLPRSRQLERRAEGERPLGSVIYAGAIDRSKLLEKTEKLADYCFSGRGYVLIYDTNHIILDGENPIKISIQAKNRRNGKISIEINDILKKELGPIALFMQEMSFYLGNLPSMRLREIVKTTYEKAFGVLTTDSCRVDYEFNDRKAALTYSSKGIGRPEMVPATPTYAREYLDDERLGFTLLKNPSRHEITIEKYVLPRMQPFEEIPHRVKGPDGIIDDVFVPGCIDNYLKIKDEKKIEEFLEKIILPM